MKVFYLGINADGELDLGGPDAYTIQVSNDGETWHTHLVEGEDGIRRQIIPCPSIVEIHEERWKMYRAVPVREFRIDLSEEHA